MSEPHDIVPPTKPLAAMRGARGLCPHCGEGKLFRSWYTIYEFCPTCGLEFEPRGGITFALNYVGSAGVTGLMVILMYIIFRPQTLLVQVLLFVAMLTLLVGTMPYRKGAFIAVDYLIRRDLEEIKMPERTGDATESKKTG